MTHDHTQGSEPSVFVKSIEARQQQFATPQARLQAIVKYCRELTDATLPPVPAMQKIGSDSSQHFKSVMISFFSELHNRFLLKPESHVFDLGCGSGRLAYPFAQLLNEHGKYYGADVWQEGIDLCVKQFPQAHMSFHHIPAKNNYYYDRFKIDTPNNFSLAFLPTNSLDLVFAISVFTHLIEEDTRAYLREFKRALKPNGCAFITCNIIDKFFFDFAHAKQITHAFVEVTPGQYNAYEGQDFFAGYTRRKWEQMALDAGLEVISLERGDWANKPGARTYQDILVLMHARDVDNV
jgi:SAM-dependent methyltransferase